MAGKNALSTLRAVQRHYALPARSLLVGRTSQSVLALGRTGKSVLPEESDCGNDRIIEMLMLRRLLKVAADRRKGP